MPPSIRSLRALEPESARVVAILGKKREIVGAGCLITASRVLTCAHVVRAALGLKHPGDPIPKGARLELRISGFEEPTEFVGRFERNSDCQGLLGDLATIKLDAPKSVKLRMTDTEFAAPFRYGGKAYSVVGFPDGKPDGYYASGVLQGMNVGGLVQLDSDSKIEVRGGFSGAPVWSSDVNAFVGLVVSELRERRVAWCIPSSALCRFYPDLPVRFRMVRADRPDVHDFDSDDPNVALFGDVSENDRRRFSITGIEKTGGGYKVDLRYECRNRSHTRGRYVTFITHASFSRPREDAYELFSELVDGVADNHIVTRGAFTLAAVGDGGDTALTCDIAKSPRCPKGLR